MPYNDNFFDDVAAVFLYAVKKFFSQSGRSFCNKKDPTEWNRCLRRHSG